jgi:hypothetical protein
LLNGFFDSDGHITIMNKAILAVSYGQKNRYILDCIKNSLNLGNIRYDRNCDCYILGIFTKEDSRYMFNRFSNAFLLSTKQSELGHLKNILTMLDLRYHFKSNPNKDNYNKIMSAINLFKQRNRF